jgi:predicted alpha-1,2-mannosidase
MIQWSPDTSPNRPDGGGYDYADTGIAGFSLTHLSGPGCAAFGDVPILPTVGAIGDTPGSATETFSHATETAQAGYYGVTLGDGVGVRLTDAARAGMAEFAFPATTQANLLFKLAGSQEPDAATSVQVVGDDELTGSVTSGYFCGETTGWERDYTLHFDIVFSQPFTASGSWAPTPIPGVGTTAGPGGEYLTFDTTASQTITAKVGISYTSAANAALNLRAEIPGWNFGQVQQASVAAWNRLLGRIQIAGGTTSQQVQFYTALYHSLLEPSVFSDVNGQYMGFDGEVHTVAPGHQEYANFSGWDIYRGQVQLAAMVAPEQTSDAITSMLNDYRQTGLLPKWNLADGETFAQVGDPADAIIADAYAFGARGFDVPAALAAMTTKRPCRTTSAPASPSSSRTATCRTTARTAAATSTVRCQLSSSTTPMTTRLRRWPGPSVTPPATGGSPPRPRAGRTCSTSAPATCRHGCRQGNGCRTSRRLPCPASSRARRPSTRPWCRSTWPA